MAKELKLFQFHYGSIKSFAVREVYTPQIGFNSTMVRLKGGWIRNSWWCRTVSIPLWFD